MVSISELMKPALDNNRKNSKWIIEQREYYATNYIFGRMIINAAYIRNWPWINWQSDPRSGLGIQRFYQNLLKKDI